MPQPAPDPALAELHAQQAGAEAVKDAILKTHHGDKHAAAQALLRHIQTEQAALALLLANGGS